VVVDHQEHVVAGDEEVVEGVQATLVEREVHLARLGCVVAHAREDPVPVEAPVLHAGEVAVAGQVVHPVHVAFAGDDLRQDRPQVSATVHEEVVLHLDVGADQRSHVAGRQPSMDPVQHPREVGSRDDQD